MSNDQIMWATHWTPAPPDGKRINDLITDAAGKTFRPERLTDRQLAAILDHPSYVGISGDRGALAVQQSIGEDEARRSLIATMDKARKRSATRREAI
jgi:hypothetical protein